MVGDVDAYDAVVGDVDAYDAVVGDVDAFGQTPFSTGSPKFHDANPFDAALAQTQQNGERSG